MLITFLTPINKALECALLKSTLLETMDNTASLH